MHVHEPIAPIPPWMITDWMRLPLVGTFHTYNENKLSNGLANLVGARRVFNRLHVRVAVSEAAAWTARRFFGGHYRIIPNGVHFDYERARLAAERPAGDKLRIVFVGQAVERKGLPLLLSAFEALRDHIPTELTLIGPTTDELSPFMLDTQNVRALGKVDDETKDRELGQADLLVAPSLRGESFGMVLTEAFAAGTPVVASNIPGYRDVVRDGLDGLLVAPGDAQALAEVLRDLHEEPDRRADMARAAVRDVQRFAWPRVTSELLRARTRTRSRRRRPQTTSQRFAVGVGLRAADLKPHVRARRLKTLEPRTATQRRSRAAALARRGGLAAVTLGGIALAYSGFRRSGSAISPRRCSTRARRSFCSGS